MSRSDDLRKADIVDACNELAELARVRKSGIIREYLLVRAAERLLEIIGEAATNCSPAMRSDYPSVDWEGLAGLRIVLAHLYHRSDPQLIWKFVEVDAPLLADQLGKT